MLLLKDQTYERNMGQDLGYKKDVKAFLAKFLCECLLSYFGIYLEQFFMLQFIVNAVIDSLNYAFLAVSTTVIHLLS